VIINHNIPAMNANRNVAINAWQGDRTAERLSSGMRINRGADDAAGLAVSEKMRAQIRGLAMASRNAQDGISMIQTAEGYLQETTSNLQRIRELSVQAANGVYTEKDRQQIQTEVGELMKEIDRIADQAQFNEIPLFTGALASDSAQIEQPNPNSPTAPAEAPMSLDKGVWLHIGPNMDQNVQFFIGDMSTAGLKMTKDQGREVNVESIEAANKTIEVADEALFIVNKQRTDLGAMQNRLETAMNGIDLARENLSSAESRVRDSDMAQQMIEFVRNSILTQASVSMVAQANLRPQAILRVLG